MKYLLQAALYTLILLTAVVAVCGVIWTAWNITIEANVQQMEER